MSASQPFGLFLVLGAAMRATRLVVADDVGRWWFRDPARRWANDNDPQGEPGEETWVDPDNGWRSKLVSGLECPFCVGFWIAGLTLLTYALFGKTPLWRFIAGWLTLNEVAAHAGARLGDVNEDD